MSLNELPVELQLRIIGHLPLTGLIKLRSTSKFWMHIIEENLDRSYVVFPPRRNLLLLWEELIRRRWFVPSRTHILPFIGPFDREAYIRNLPGASIPDEFELWLREWPLAATIGWIWPGLDGKYISQGDTWWRTCLRSHLCAEQIQEDGREYSQLHFWPEDGDLEHIRKVDAIQIHCSSDAISQDTEVMLVLGGGGPLDGTVQFQCRQGTVYLEEREDNEFSASWVDWLRRQMDFIDGLSGHIFERKPDLQS